MNNKNKRMKIAYLHGLESNNTGAKNDWLRTIAEVYNPLIDYKKRNIYQLIKTDVIEFQPDVITGSSMGGFFAYEIARELNIPAILFNPAIHGRSFTPDMTGQKGAGIFKPAMFIVLGAFDELIEPLKTIEILRKEGYGKDDYIVLEHGHRTPFEVFEKEIKFFIEKLFNPFCS